MKVAIKILKEAKKHQQKIRLTSVKKDSYKGVLESEKTIKDIQKAINYLEKPISVKK